MKRLQFRAAVGLVLIAVLCLCTVFHAAAESYYVENEWNYAEGSMDVDHGIPDNATGVMDRIKRKGVLRVATEPYFAPYEFIDHEQFDQRQYAGADMELARLIAEKMGVELIELNRYIAAESTQKKVNHAIADLKKGKIKVFSGNYTGVNPINPADTIDLNAGYTENQYSSNPSFGYILRDYITVEN